MATVRETVGEQLVQSTHVFVSFHQRNHSIPQDVMFVINGVCDPQQA